MNADIGECSSCAHERPLTLSARGCPEIAYLVCSEISLPWAQQYNLQQMAAQGKGSASVIGIRETVEWLYNLLKPKIHNRIALIVIGAGLASIAAPLWLPVVQALLMKEFGAKFDQPSSPWIGITLVITGLVYHAITHAGESGALRSARVASIEHDKRLADQVRNILPESKVNDMLGSLGGAHAYRDRYAILLDESDNLLSSGELHFLNKEIRENCEKLKQASSDLREFISQWFFVYPRHQTHNDMQYAMQPSLCCDREGDGSYDQIAKYDELTAQLNERIRNYQAAYLAFIGSFHTQLHH
ncbi:MAG: hypothetical protein HY765_02840 [Rhodomicrobium sp.]|nr:hypothetical protein [Rhodomicrobium sp.]